MRALIGFVRGLPVATKLITFLYTVFSVTTIVLRRRAQEDLIDREAAGIAGIDPGRFFVLRPGTVARYPWTLVTGALVEGNIAFLVCGIIVLCSVGSFLERQWGTRGYSIFMLITSVVPAITSILAIVILYAVRGSADILYTTQICGLASIVSAYTVGLKQLVPDYTVKLFRGALSFRVNDVSGVYTLVAPIMFTFLGDVGSVLLVNIGFVESFIYLRFYKRSGSTCGDRSEAFAFTTFFPEFVRPYVGKLSGVVYNVAVRLRVVTADEGYVQAVDLEEGSFSEPVDVDADRRRALAAKALEQRLETENTGASNS
ncbi:hypothetical protein IWW43_004055 [Coemansia sp. RSA 1935]|nr:hypothetical protein LPJ54_003887 [Coemansia sp. RSA 1824]KAJ2530932.1 hypothetical protein IWW43_004055 [Coemansia sp. RSA 1935]KAJ2546018.1 hypothetical protein IWW35_005190 [Coemansia sp. RSA 1878]